MKNKRLFFISLLVGVATSVIAGTPTYEVQPSPTPAEENHRELFDYELDYTGNSSFFDDHGKFGNGDSLYNDFSYAHRFLITGKWYFRQASNTSGSISIEPTMGFPIIFKPCTLYWRSSSGFTIMPAPVLRSDPVSFSK